MARESGIHRRQGSRFWWIDVALPDGQRLRRSTKTEDRKEAQALLHKLKLEAYRGALFGIKPKRSWQEAVVRYLAVKANLRSIEDTRRICRQLDPYFGRLSLDQITGLEWDRVDLARGTAWLDQTKNGTPRGVPLNRDAVTVLEEQRGKHLQFCFTFRGEPIRWQLSNSGWVTALQKAGLQDFRFHDLRHTWASWHRQAGTSTDELKDLGGWKSRVMVDRYAKFATENLAHAAASIETGRCTNVVQLRHIYGTVQKAKG